LAVSFCFVAAFLHTSRIKELRGTKKRKGREDTVVKSGELAGDLEAVVEVVFFFASLELGAATSFFVGAFLGVSDSEINTIRDKENKEKG
jgi:hypothetical protein